MSDRRIRRIERIFTAYLRSTNTLRLIHQSFHCAMDRFDESYHSCPIDKSDESNRLCPIDRIRPVLISFPYYCSTKITNRTDGVDSTVLDNPQNPPGKKRYIKLAPCLNNMMLDNINYYLHTSLSSKNTLKVHEVYSLQSCIRN